MGATKITESFQLLSDGGQEMIFDLHRHCVVAGFRKGNASWAGDREQKKAPACRGLVKEETQRGGTL
jgi:hypothetical protein